MPFATVTLLASVGLLLIGHGIQLTLLPLYASSLGWDAGLISLTAATYFIGFMMGSLLVPRLLARAGYIRVFLTLSALLAVVILSLSLVQNTLAWAGLRLLTGICIAGIYMVSESWINALTHSGNRGRILSVYILVTLSGIGIGQTLVGLLPLAELFQVCAILMLLALIPVGLFCNQEPVSPEYIKPSLGDLKHLPGLAVVAILLGGVMTGSVWAVAPLYGLGKGLSSWEISLMMNAIVFGGVCFQIPFGILSDRFDRRGIIVLVVALCLIVLCLIPVALLTSHNAFFFMMFLFGGVSLTQYALGSAYANEYSKLSRVRIASMVLLLNGTGSVLGPLLTSLITPYSSDALLIVSAGCMALLLLTALGGFARQLLRSHLRQPAVVNIMLLPLLPRPSFSEEAIIPEAAANDARGIGQFKVGRVSRPGF